MQWPTAILISCHPTLAVPGCLQYHAVLRAIKGYILGQQARGHTWAFELHCDTVDIDRVGDIDILAIIVFAPEVDNGATGSVNGHYKCGHIIAALDANVTVDYLGDIYVHLRGHSQVKGIWCSDVSGYCVLLGQEA